jgi:ATP/maltotriose-dependent transcriptional regulator MalT
MGLYKEALEHYELATAFKDSIFNEKKRKNIAEILTRYETEKKEQQIELLDKYNQLKSQRIRIQWIAIIAILLISLSGALISRLIIKNKNHKLRQMNLELHNYLLQLNDPLKRLVAGHDREDDPVGELVDQFGLTQREAEIMDLIRQGLTNQELGDRLFVSSNTIKYHIKNIYIKLDVKNRVQALQKTTLVQHHQAN